MKKTVVFWGGIDVWHYPDGTIELRASGSSLLFITYDRLGELDQGSIVDNKREGRALEMIKLVLDKCDHTHPFTGSANP